MKSIIKLCQQTDYEGREPDTLVFSGGEVNIKLPEGLYGTVYINARIADSDGIMALALVKDALDRNSEVTEVMLNLPYIPYARQDRVCNDGEALSIKVFANMINSMGFAEVSVNDPHSDVAPALIDNCSIVEQWVFANTVRGDFKHVTLVSPDYGATKKTEKLAQIWDCEVIQGVKKRDTKTGNLSGFDYYGNVEGKHLLIVDDICDGGGTFIGLTEKLLEGGAETVSLFVTHGIFSKGVDVLLDNGIHTIYTTDSFNHGLTHERLEIIKI